MWALFFGFSGRINRAKYWGYSLLLVLLFILPIAAAIGVGTTTNLKDNTVAIVVFVVLFIVWIFVIWFANIALGAKRLHDRNKSGWWIFLYYVVPSVMQQHGVWSQANAAAKVITIVFAVIGIGISIWAIIDLGFLRGTDGPNAYGPDPLAPTGT